MRNVRCIKRFGPGRCRLDDTKIETLAAAAAAIYLIHNLLLIPSNPKPNMRICGLWKIQQ